MPELPEVEGVVMTLRDCVKGEVITDTRVFRPALIRPHSPSSFHARLKGRRIDDVRRRGKFILLELSGGQTLIVHMRMTGNFLVGRVGGLWPEATRVVFQLRTGKAFGFSDRRNLGMMKLVPSAEVERLKMVQNLGVEPLEPDFTLERFRALLRPSRRSIKEFLLDQSKIVGLGNIYIAEALHRARIGPTRPASSVARSTGRSSRLYQAIIDTLRDALGAQREEGPTHVTSEGVTARRPGDRTGPEFLVYGREGELCLRCRARIRRMRQGARSTYYCPRCQR